MNNFQDVKKSIEELESSSLKLSIDGIIVYVLDWKILSNNQMYIDYICFDKRAESQEFYNKIQKTLTVLLEKEIRENKWYRILFSKICAPIKNIRKRFGHS